MRFHKILLTLVHFHFEGISAIQMENAAVVVCVVLFTASCHTGNASKNLVLIQYGVVTHGIAGTIVVVHLTVNIVRSRTTDHQCTLVLSKYNITSYMTRMIFLPAIHGS